MNNYYTYAYLREDRTPYYIGKGKGYRIHKGCGRAVNLPPKERRLFLKQNLTEDEAFKHEKYMIAIFGRKDLGTGILRNMTDGGQGVSGKVFTEEHKRKIGEETKKKWSTGVFNEQSYEKWKNAAKGEKNSMYGKTHTEEATKKITAKYRKHYRFVSPDGKEFVEFTTISEFCKKNKMCFKTLKAKWTLEELTTNS